MRTRSWGVCAVAIAAAVAAMVTALPGPACASAAESPPAASLATTKDDYSVEDGSGFPARVIAVVP